MQAQGWYAERMDGVELSVVLTAALTRAMQEAIVAICTRTFA